MSTDAPSTTPANPLDFRALRARFAAVALVVLAASVFFSVAPGSLRTIPGVGALAAALEPGTASADSYYNDEACQGTTANWSLSESGGNALYENYTPCTSANAFWEPKLVWNSSGLGVAGGNDYYFFYVPSGLTVSHFSASEIFSQAADGFGSGVMGDVGGSGMLADNDPRNLQKGQAVPNSTVGQGADCWGYGNSYTQVVTVDHSPDPGDCEYTAQPASYSIAGAGYTGVGIGAQSRSCADTSDGGSCENGTAEVQMYDGTVQVDDPAAGPSLTGINVSGMPSGWTPSEWISYRSDSGTIGTSVAASDAGGVCNVRLTIAGPSGTVAAGGNATGTLPAGYDQSSGAFSATSGHTPAGCPTSGAGASTSGLSLNGLASGTYTIAAQAQNPANIVGSGATSGSSTTFNVDNQVPTVSISGGSGHWSSSGSQTYSVSAGEAQGLSGISSITCTGAGLPAGGQTFSGDSAQISESAQGDDAITCYATTGAGVGGADGTNVGSQTGTQGHGNDILIDTATPSVGVDNDSPADNANGLVGNWVDPATNGTPETVDVYAAAGVSGIAGTTSESGTFDQWSTGGTPVTTGTSTEASLDNIQSGESTSNATIDGNTYAMPYCTVTDLSDPTSSGGSTTYNAANGANVGDGSNAAATPSIDTDNKYVEWQVPFTENGHYQLDCTVTNGAGVTTALATQTIEVDQTNASDLQQAAQTATHNAGPAVDADGGNDASTYVNTANQSAPRWSGDPLTLTYTPAEASSGSGDWPTTADMTDTSEVDPIIETVCTPGGNAAGDSTNTTVASSPAGPNPTQTDPNSLTVGNTSYSTQSSNLPQTPAPADDGNDQVTCTETNAAGTTSDPTTYYMNIDQQAPTVAYDQPAGDTGGQDPSHAVAADPSALSAKTGLPQRDFGLAPLRAKLSASAADPVPATGHLAPAGPAEFKLNGHADTTGVQYSSTATQVNATSSQLTQLSGISGEYCSDTNQTEPGPGGNEPWPYGDGGPLGVGGSTATLDVPQPANSNDAVTGIHSLDCYGQDNSSYTGNPTSPQAGGTTQQYPGADSSTAYNYTVNVDDVTPATIGWGIVNQGETVTNPDPYTYDPGQWYQDETTLTASAQEVGNDISDIDALVCAINDPSFGQPNATYTNPVTDQQVPYYDYTLDPAAAEHPTDSNDAYSAEIPVNADNGSGTYYLSCFAVSGSGVNGTVATTEVNLQKGTGGTSNGGGNCTEFCTGSADPSLVVPPSGITPIPGGQQWHTTNQQVPVIAVSPAGSAPIESITCNEPPATLTSDTSNPDASDNGDGTITYPNPAGTDSNTESITVTVGPPPFGEAEPPLECYATDAAGVDHTLGSEQVNVDDTPPTGYFIRPNANNPRKVTLYTTDNNGSGVAKVLIQLVDSGGKIYNLPLTSTTTGDGDYTAELPPDSQLANGSYTLQAIVTDNAGNVTNPPIDQWEGADGVDGPVSVITYPVLGASRMLDALAAGTTAPLLPGDKATNTTRVQETQKVRVKQRGKWVTKTVPVYKITRVKVRHGAKTTWVTKKVAVYRTVKTPAQVHLASVKTPVKLAFAGKSTADGIATTGAGVLIAGGTVRITQAVNGAPQLLGTVTTNKAGRWTYHVPAGPSRQLAFQYTGTALLDPASGSSGAELVTGSLTLKAPKTVKVGRKLVLSGSLPGGYIPAAGLPLRVYYTEKGARGVGGYTATYRTNAKGVFKITEPSRRSSRGHIYTFWVQAVAPTAWPYTGAVSKKLTVKFN